MKIMVTGARGFLASRLCRYLQEQRHEVTGFSHEQLDITSYEAVRQSLREIRPEEVIHCAAISDVAACAEDEGLSFRVNVRGTENIARASGEMGIRLIFCSSDQIYFGSRGDMPHAEDEEVCPPHVYGRHKLLAEQICRKENAGSICLRLSLMYDKHIRGREHGNLLSNVLKAAQEKKAMSYPVYDFRSITDVWEVVRNMERLSQIPGGIYNFGSENDLSTFEIVKLILKFSGHANVHLQENREAFADCPRNLRMDIGRVRAHGIDFTRTAEGLQKVFQSDAPTCADSATPLEKFHR